jgi:hypothetical protein
MNAEKSINAENCKKKIQKIQEIPKNAEKSN